MFKKNDETKTVLRDLGETAPTFEELETPELKLVSGGIWKPSWTPPRDPDDIFRDDG